MLPDRIKSKFRISNNCWEWIAAKNKNGYGILSFKGRTREAYRVIYELLHGPIKKGLELDHLCRNRACVNPEHLEPVTHAENMRRGGLAGLWEARRRITHCPKGHSYSGYNLQIVQNGKRKARSCRTCTVASTRRWRVKQRLASQPI